MNYGFIIHWNNYSYYNNKYLLWKKLINVNTHIIILYYFTYIYSFFYEFLNPQIVILAVC